MVNANHFKGLTDNEIIENAIANRDIDGMVLIPPRSVEAEPERNWWLLDRAILLPENTTVILQNCKIKLSDQCRDNFFRTANCGMGIAFPEPIKNVRIKGEGHCILEGADHPRATGDGSKILANPCPYLDEDLCQYADWIPEERRKTGKLDFWDKHAYSYGTDAGKSGESGHGDWRGIGILFANLQNFSIKNIKIVCSHGWGISLEACAYGRVEKIEFDACMSKEIDGMLQNMENQDGIDLRNGCHHILISDVMGQTGDDVIALTAIANEDAAFRPGGSLNVTQIMHNDWMKRERDIHDIIIRNVIAHSHLCFLVRLLPCNARIWNVVIDGVVDTTPDDLQTGAGILLGDFDGYGKNLTDSMRNFSISNIICNRPSAVLVEGYLSDSVISNVTNRRRYGPAVYSRRQGGLKNVDTSSLSAVDAPVLKADDVVL